MRSFPYTGIVCTCIGFSPLPSQCVSYTAEFMIICTGYNKRSSMLHCLQSWCVSSFCPPPPLPAYSEPADGLLWSGSNCAWPGSFHLSHMLLLALCNTFLGKWLLSSNPQRMCCETCPCSCVENTYLMCFNFLVRKFMLNLQSVRECTSCWWFDVFRAQTWLLTFI